MAENEPIHERGGVPTEVFIEQEVFSSNCTDCLWHSDFTDDREEARELGLWHENDTELIFGKNHRTFIVKCTMLYERDDSVE